MLTTAAAILANPRHTGRHGLNRQHTDQDGLDADGAIGATSRESSLEQRPALGHRPHDHPPLVSEEQPRGWLAFPDVGGTPQAALAAQDG
jgi:hypothetical protein